MKILFDSREPPYLAGQIAAHPLLGQPEIATLPCGDIWLDNLIVERKEPPDLLESIKDGRLFNQAAEMRAEAEWCYLLIMGQIHWGADGKIIGTGWNFRAIEGALLTVQELGVSVVHAQSSNDLAASLAWIATRERGRIMPLAPRRFGIPMLPSTEALAALPGIGPERAHTLLGEHGDLTQALVCLLDPACQIPGIGPKTKEKIRELFNLAQGETLQKVIIKNE